MPGQFQLIRAGYICVSEADHSMRGSGTKAGTRSFLLFFAVLCVACLTMAARLHAEVTRPGEARSGTLLFKAVEEGKFVRAPLVATDFEVTVSGPTARTRVTQHFYNPADGWVEGVYVYPLPDNAAVDTLKAVVGDRVIVGEIKERKEAKQIYERAKAQGKKAALLEQERPNMFTNSLANIGPGETVVVQMEYQQTIPHAGEEFALRLPLVVAPRYNPAPIVQNVSFDSGWGMVSDPVPDRARISPPVLDPEKHRPVNPVTLTVRLQAGFPLGEVKSHHHKVRIKKVSADTRIVTVEGAVPADRDFELTWSAKPGRAPAAGIFHERVGNADYLLAFVTPPALETSAPRPSREMIFVIDTSGSMAGVSIVQAKASLVYALERLSAGDRFNIISFNSTHHQLFPAAVPADAAHLAIARSYVSSLHANNGTNMVPAMQAALVDPGSNDSGELRQVIFLTDGAIGNERQLFDAIASGLGRSRIFMVGIGSAPNSYLMRHAAAIGRGGVTHIGSASQVEDRMRTLFTRLEKPAVTDLHVRFSAADADVTPSPLPDLYAEETLQVAARLSALKGNAEISGMVGGRPWSVKLPLAKAAAGKGISKLWAREKIKDAEIGVRLRRIPQAEADDTILALALEHGLVSRLTSLVAVDATPDRPAGAPLTRADVPLNLPAGWEFDKVFGNSGERDASGGEFELPETRDRDAKLDNPSLKKIAVVDRPGPAHPAAKQTTAGIPLPRTATQSLLHLRLGLVAVLAAMVLLLAARRRAGRVRP